MTVRAASTLLQGRRGSLQRWFIARVEGEAKWIANIQKSYKHPLLDRYFHWSAILGTPTFFVLSLPGLFFFGYHEVGRPLLVVLSLGAWLGSLSKDLVCSPRPRLGVDAVVQTLSNHHQEYGFPSTHTTNAVTAFLFISELLLQLPISVYVPLQALFVIYLLSVISGRIYNGMHGPLDISGGIILGSLCWAFHPSGLEARVEDFLGGGTWFCLAALVFLPWAALTFHPETPDDCPCYDQAVTGLGAIFGLWFGIWLEGWWNLEPIQWIAGGSWLFGSLRLISGLLAMFAFQVVAKIILQATLPSLLASAYRFLGWNEPILSDRTDLPAIAISVTSINGSKETGGVMSLKQVNVHAENGKASATALSNIPGVNTGRTKEIWEKSENIRKFLIYAGITFIATFALPRIFPLIGI